MRIGLDGTPLAQPGTGIAVYTEHLARALAAERPKDEFVLVTNVPVPLEDRRLPANLSVRVLPSWLSSRTAWIMTRGPRWLDGLGLDLFHFTNSGAGPLTMNRPYVMSVHDLTPRLLAEHHPWKSRLLSRLWWPAAARRAPAVLAPTRRSAADIHRELGVPEQRVQVVPYATAPVFSRGRDAAELMALRRRYRLPHPFILNVSTWEPRKNQRGLLAAFDAALARREIPHALVFAGPPGWGRPAPDLKTLPPRLRGRVVHLGLLPQEDLAGVYRLAELFSYPSLGEGFGLPNLEAMASGTPVVTSLDPAIEEVVGDAAMRVDVANVDEFASALLRLALEAGLRADLRRRGLERARLFSWARTARGTWTVYETVLRGRHGR